MERTVFTTLTKEELSDLISESLQKSLKNFKPKEKKEQKLLTQKEAANFLGVSQPTLIKYKKEGLVSCKQMGKRYYYSKNDLINSMKEINNNRNSFFGWIRYLFCKTLKIFRDIYTKCIKKSSIYVIFDISEHYQKLTFTGIYWQIPQNTTESFEIPY